MGEIGYGFDTLRKDLVRPSLDTSITFDRDKKVRWDRYERIRSFPRVGSKLLIEKGGKSHEAVLVPSSTVQHCAVVSALDACSVPECAPMFHCVGRAVQTTQILSVLSAHSVP